jgi:tetratricopeptide (TPR) repeat protein
MLNRFGDSKENLVWHKASQGRIHEAKNEADLARTAYSAAIILNEENAQANAAMGRLLMRQAEFDSAMYYYETAVQLEPSNIHNYIAMAKILEATEKFGEAVAVYEQIVRRNPKNYDVYLMIAYIKEDQGDAKGAIKALNDGLRYGSGDANILFKLGRLYLATKQYDKAIESYQASLGRGKANGQNVEALRMIGDIYYTKLMNEKKAMEYFKKYVRAGGKNSGVDMFMKRMGKKS